KVFPKAKPDQVIQKLDGMLKSASNHTFGIKPLRTIPLEKLKLVEIPVAGLDCIACCLAAYEAIYSLDGVERATVSFRDGWITALIDPEKTDRTRLVTELKARGVQITRVEITHSFLAAGGETYILGGDGKIIWQYPHGSRDGWVLPNGNVLLALSHSKKYPGGGVVEVTRAGKVLFEYQGTQSEVNTAQFVEKDRVLLTEAGAKPRLLEINREGKIVVEVPLKAQTKDHHLQSRMARKLANGNYLVPQLLDRVVREYTPARKIAWEVKTP